MEKKIIFFDLDGTLISKNNKILEANILAIKKAIDNGVYVSLATGRSLNMALPILEQLKLNAPIILVNGSVMYDTNTQEITTLSTPHSQITKDFYVDYTVKNNTTLVFTTSKDDYLYSVDDDQKALMIESHNLIDLSDKSIDEVKKIMSTLDIVHLSLVKPLNKTIQETFDDFAFLIENNSSNIVTSSELYIDGDPIGISKLSGIQHVLKLLDINNKDNVYVFGDSDNDYLMINYFPNSIAMGNANKKIKQTAKYIIGNNTEPAIANFVENFILKK